MLCVDLCRRCRTRCASGSDAKLGSDELASLLSKRREPPQRCSSADHRKCRPEGIGMHVFRALVLIHVLVASTLSVLACHSASPGSAGCQRR